jgi:hypothetical protein
MRFVLLFALLTVLTGCATPPQPSVQNYCYDVPGPNYPDLHAGPHGSDHPCTDAEQARWTFYFSDVPGWWCPATTGTLWYGPPHRVRTINSDGSPSDIPCVGYMLENFFGGQWPTPSPS